MLGTLEKSCNDDIRQLKSLRKDLGFNYTNPYKDCASKIDSTWKADTWATLTTHSNKNQAVKNLETLQTCTLNSR